MTYHKIYPKIAYASADRMVWKMRDHTKYSQGQDEQRLSAMLRGAFAGPPTPLKDIPTRTGESRKLREKPQRRLRRQRKNRTA